MQKTETKPATRKADPPCRYWRNKWRCVEGSGYTRCRATGERRFVGVGNEFLSVPVWPSKEIAEQKAIEVVETSPNPAIYLGPVPCDRNGNPL